MIQRCPLQIHTLMLPAPSLPFYIYCHCLSKLTFFFLAHSSPLLLPAPHFRFFGQFMNTFLHAFLFHFIYPCTYMIIGIEQERFDRFLGVQPAARAGGMDCQLLQEPGTQKVSRNSYVPSDTYCIHSPWHICSREALWRPTATPNYKQGGCTATRPNQTQRKHGSLIWRQQITQRSPRSARFRISLKGLCFPQSQKSGQQGRAPFEQQGK